MTTVTINEELRQKLKRLAEKHDTTQADIIKRALELFEKYERHLELNRFRNRHAETNESSKFPDNARKFKVLEVLIDASAKFEKKYPEIAQRRKKLQQNIHLLNEITVADWALPFEE